MVRFLSDFLDQRRKKAAVRWHMRVQDNMSQENSGELSVWLEKGKNRQAYDQVGRAWGVLESHQYAPQVLAVRREALSRARGNSRMRLWPAWTVAAAATAVALVIAAGPLFRPDHLDSSTVYATAAKQRRIVTLSDHSHIWLDADSAVRVQSFDQHARKLWLIKGRARFDVAHDKTRPFEVTAGRETTVAVGTSFDVEQLNAKVLVTVTEGRVRVMSAEKSAEATQAVFLNAGQKLTANREGIVVKNIDSFAENGWEQGKIILSDERLDDAVVRINRYLSDPLLVSPDIADMRVSGIFNAGDAPSFVSALVSYFPIQSHTSAQGHVTLEKRG